MTKPDPTSPRMDIPALLAALVMMIGLTAWPHWLSRANGQADHLAALLACMAMSIGFIRGVGFVPRHRVWQWLCSWPVMLGALVGTGWRLWGG